MTNVYCIGNVSRVIVERGVVKFATYEVAVREGLLAETRGQSMWVFPVYIGVWPALSLLQIKVLIQLRRQLFPAAVVAVRKETCHHVQSFPFIDTSIVEVGIVLVGVGTVHVGVGIVLVGVGVVLVEVGTVLVGVRNVLGCSSRSFACSRWSWREQHRNW